jgi:hypothetical protein
VVTERDPGDEHAETRRTLELSPDAIARLCALAKGADSTLDATVDWFVNAALDRAGAPR